MGGGAGKSRFKDMYLQQQTHAGCLHTVWACERSLDRLGICTHRFDTIRRITTKKHVVFTERPSVAAQSASRLHSSDCSAKRHQREQHALPAESTQAACVQCKRSTFGSTCLPHPPAAAGGVIA